jgi:signal transduction histidine kinase
MTMSASPRTESAPQPDDSDPSPPRRQTHVVAVLAIGLSVLVALEGPRAWGAFSRLLLPVLTLSLAGTFTACLTVSDRTAGKVTGYPLLCSFGGLLGGFGGLCIDALLKGWPLEVMAARPIAWHMVAGGLVTGGLVGSTLWWLHHQWRHDSQRALQLFDSRADLLRARAEVAEADAARSRMALQLLQAQIEPHFLYNALANLRYLVRHDAQLAQRMIDQLVRYFRVVLPSLREIEVSLAQELELCEAFGAIQALRVGDRLQLDIDVAADLRDARLPPAVLLTLVENAFKHGMPPAGAVAHVTIAARRVDAQLHLSVVDNGPCADQSTVSTRAESGSGMGLRWLGERLHAVHGDQASLSLERLSTGGCRAQMMLPLQRIRVP